MSFQADLLVPQSSVIWASTEVCQITRTEVCQVIGKNDRYAQAVMAIATLRYESSANQGSISVGDVLSSSKDRKRKTLGQLMDVAATTSGCVLWPFDQDSKGYRVLRQGGRSERTHCVMWMLKYGAVPPADRTYGIYANKHCVQSLHNYVDYREQSPKECNSFGSGGGL